MSIADKYTTLTTEKIPKVYEAGYEKGKAEGGDSEGAYNQGVEDGKKSEYDAFWDAYQQNGSRTDYDRAFKGAWWNDITFKPKYDITIAGTTNEAFHSSTITDLKGICESREIQLDFSQATYILKPFEKSKITRLPVLDVSKIPNLETLLTGAKQLEWVEGVILNEDGSQRFGNGIGYNWTLYSGNIKHLPILSGTIGTNFYINSEQNLDKESITSIINALSASTSGLTATFSKTAVNAAFETSIGVADGSASTEWATLIATKQNWTISLV